MELQKVFKHSYMDRLRKNINISDYQQEEFPYEPTGRFARAVGSN